MVDQQLRHAETVDHIIPYGEDQSLAGCPSNQRVKARETQESGALTFEETITRTGS